MVVKMSPLGVYDRTLSNCSRMLNPTVEPSTDLAYILGVLLGDGTVYRNKRRNGAERIIALSVKDLEFAKAFLDALRKINLHPHFYFYRKNATYRVRAYSRIFHDWFKSLDMEKIEQLVTTSPELARSFLKGFYDSEGSLILSTKRYCQGRRYYEHPLIEVRMSNTDNKKASLIFAVLKYLGFHPRIYKMFKTGGLNSAGVIEITISLKSRNEVLKFITEVGSSIPRKARLHD